jgi:hypothetical protein
VEQAPNGWFFPSPWVGANSLILLGLRANYVHELGSGVSARPIDQRGTFA